MSRVSTAIAVTGFLFSGASLAEDYRCASFANDVYGQDAGEASSSYEFAVSRGIVDGVFVASQRSPLAVSQDQTRGQFRRAVAVRCSSHPDETVENAALTVSGLLPDASEYRSMAPLDFNLAKSSIVGTKVSLSGDLSVGSDSATLYSDEMNTNSIKIDISQLAQTDREYLTENCRGLCQITINGAVSKFNFSEGLKAESIAHE